MLFLEYIWVVPLLPLLGAAVMFFFGRGSRPRPAFAGGHVPHGTEAEHVEASPEVTHFDPHAAHGPADDASHLAHGGHNAHAAEPYANPEAPHTFVNAVCVGMVVIAFFWSCAAVWQYTSFAHG